MQNKMFVDIWVLYNTFAHYRNFLVTVYIFFKLCWLSYETLLGVWNLSAVLQNVCLYKLNVFCMCKIVYACHMFFFYICICLCFSLKINNLQKKCCTLWYIKYCAVTYIIILISQICLYSKFQKLLLVHIPNFFYNL